MEIHVAGPEDAVAIAKLVAGFRDHLRARRPTDAELARFVPETLTDPAIEFCWAELAGEAVGYTHTRYSRSLWELGTEAHLEDLFVVSEARGRAVGRALLRHAIERARARGARAFTLNTNERNEAAQALYRAEGLRPQSHRLWPDGREVFWVRALGGD